MPLKSVKLSTIKVGDEVEIEEHFPNYFIHVRGEVSHLDEGGVIVGDPGHVVLHTAESRNVLKVWVKAPDLPTEAGSIVAYFDGNLLREGAAILAGVGEWFDTRSGRPVELHRLEWDVLFDAAKQ